jgi:hypothetical protein
MINYFNSRSYKSSCNDSIPEWGKIKNVQDYLFLFLIDSDMAITIYSMVRDIVELETMDNKTNSVAFSLQANYTEWPTLVGEI